MGALDGLRVVEFAALGPSPFGAMLLADAGAEVVRVTRPGHGFERDAITSRGRPSLSLDLKDSEGRQTALDLVEAADVLLEGFRPGVMERLGLGPDECLNINPRLVYGRATGWGQDGPLAGAPGHDINYLALTGALHSIARRGEAPVPPLNMVADYGGGGMLLLVGVLCALLERTRSGQGQVIDAAMIDGTALLMSTVWDMLGQGRWSDTPGTNLMDTGAPFYNVYETADGRYVAVGCVEPRFYAEFLRMIEIDPSTMPPQNEAGTWPEAKRRVAERLATRTRDEWSTHFDGSEACVTPVLTIDEARAQPHLRSRGTLVVHDGHLHPAPAPRLSRTPARLSPEAYPDAATVLARWGVRGTPLQSGST